MDVELTGNHPSTHHLGDHTVSRSDGGNAADAIPQVDDASDISVQEGAYLEPMGPLTQSEAENLQREANEDTTRSEDLRQFLQEMREKIKEEQAQVQQQLQAQAAGIVTHHQPQANVIASQYSTFSRHLSAVPDSLVDPYQLGNQPPVLKFGNQVHRGSVPDLYEHDAAPDGGWSWIVMFSSFCCLVLVDGIGMSYGLLLSPHCGYSDLKFVAPTPPTSGARQSQRERILRPTLGSCVPVSELGEEMGTQSRMLLLTPGALLLGIYLFLGPLVSALTNQFDVRPVTMAGAILSTIALLASSFSPRLDWFVVSYGVLGGIGLSLIYLPSIATVGQWFRRRRPLAVGLALCGSGVGCLLGAQGVPRLVNWFTWRGALVIMAAASFQSLVLIVLFRPLDIHFRICQVQRAKRALRESARRKSALRRLEIERRLAEIRMRKRLAHDGAHKMGDGRQIPPDWGKSPIDQDPKRHTQGMLDTYGMLRGTGNRVRVGAILTRSGRGGGGAHAIVVGPPRFHNRGDTGGRGHGPLGRRPGSYRGSIMQRIIEEKRRQRTTSVGSLDGMVITRDNQLIAAPMQSIASDRPLISHKTITRISESIAKKYESKLQQVVQADGNVSGISGAAIARSLRTSLPYIVQEYIQSQISVMPPIQPANADPSGTTTGLITPKSSCQHPPAGTDRDSLNEPIQMLSSRLVDTGTRPSTPVGGDGVTHPSDPFLLMGSGQLAHTAAATAQQQSAGAARVSICPSESISLQRHTSETSLESNQPADSTGANAAVPLADASCTMSMADAAELLLDSEIRADIQNRLRRELARPQYKKDLFYTGSVRHLSMSHRLSQETASAGYSTSSAEKHYSFVAPGLIFSPTTSIRTQGLRTSVLGISHAAEHGTAFHNSQTNVSLAPSTGTGCGTAFVPPAPCPAVYPHQPTPTPLLPPLSLQAIGGETGDSCNALQQNESEPRRPMGTEHSPFTPISVAGQTGFGEDEEAAVEDLQDPDFGPQSDLDDGDEAEITAGLDVTTRMDDECVQSTVRPCVRLRRWLGSCGSRNASYFGPMLSFFVELLDPRILTKRTFWCMLLSTTATMMGKSTG